MTESKNNFLKKAAPSLIAILIGLIVAIIVIIVTQPSVAMNAIPKFFIGPFNRGLGGFGDICAVCLLDLHIKPAFSISVLQVNFYLADLWLFLFVQNLKKQLTRQFFGLLHFWFPVLAVHCWDQL